MCLLVDRRRLREFKFKIATILVASFVGDVIGDEGAELGNSPRVAHVIAAKAGHTKRIARLRLDTLRRRPAHAVHFERSVIPLADIPIYFGQENGLISGAWDWSQFRQQIVERGIVTGKSARIGNP